jgi:hypothetical protein
MFLRTSAAKPRRAPRILSGAPLLIMELVRYGNTKMGVSQLWLRCRLLGEFELTRSGKQANSVRSWIRLSSSKWPSATCRSESATIGLPNCTRPSPGLYRTEVSRLAYPDHFEV